MALAAARVERQRPARDVEDLGLVLRARAGDTHALDQMIRRYAGFVRLKASSYFIAGGDSDDLIQEGLVGLYKAVRDYRVDREASFRSFAELCITRQIITAIKGATRYKHSPLNGYVSFSHTPAGPRRPGRLHARRRAARSGGRGSGAARDREPGARRAGREPLDGLSGLEARVLALFLEGRPYEEIATSCECDPKAVDNALQRVKRKIGVHLARARRARRLSRALRLELLAALAGVRA